MAPDLTQLTDSFVQAQLRGDRREAIRLVMEDGLRRGASVRDIQLAVIQEAQRRIGQLWQENVVTVAQEHLATAISNMALAHLYDHADPRPRNGRVILVACVEGEQHDFPARLVADALDIAGFDVRYLGANVPTGSLLAMARDQRPDMVALSTTMSFNLPALRAAVTQLRAELGSGLRIAVGGGACDATPDLAGEVGADATARDAAEFVTAAEQLLGVAR